MAQRHDLLAEAHAMLADAAITLAPDDFPIVTGRLDNGSSARIELIADTMITRRLPQLWLRVTLTSPVGRDGPTIGALARPTGAEYYSSVHEMPEWMQPPETGTSMLMRGDGRATLLQATQVRSHFKDLFADPRVKEATIASRSVRILYQVSQGERASHMFLRQARFALECVPQEAIRAAILLATRLESVLAEPQRGAAPKAA